MNHDLLEARAAVDWAVDQLVPLTARIEAWQQTRPYELVTYFDPERRKKAFKYEIKNPLPLIFNAEVGAILNSIRSSLDILAVSLARRNCATRLQNVYFPICESAAVFANSGIKKIKELSSDDQATISGLSPYREGNDLLYALHQMDITRKHRKLLAVHSDNIHFELSGVQLDVDWAYDLRDDRPSDKSILAWVHPDAPKCNAKLSVHLTLARTPPLQPEEPIRALREFAQLAYQIIDRF